MNQRVNKIKFCGFVQNQNEASERINHSGDAVIVKRGKNRSLVMMCPCGCKDRLVINLDPRAAAAWRVYQNKKKGLSLFPSVWRESGCGSHFIIWNDKIYWCDYDSLWDEGESDISLEKRVLKSLTFNFSDYTDIAESVNEIPWPVLLACRRLVHNGSAIEGIGKMKAHFALVR